MADIFFSPTPGFPLGPSVGSPTEIHPIEPKINFENISSRYEESHHPPHSKATEVNIISSYHGWTAPAPAPALWLDK